VKGIYPGGLGASVESVVALSDGGLIVTGSTFAETQGDIGYILKIDEMGIESWKRTFGELWSINDAVESSDKGVVFIAEAYGYTLIRKLNTQGEIAWDQQVKKHHGRSIASSEDGGYVLACSSFSPLSAKC